jgi:hypothetical protein
MTNKYAAIHKRSLVPVNVADDITLTAATALRSLKGIEGGAKAVPGSYG